MKIIWGFWGIIQYWDSYPGPGFSYCYYSCCDFEWIDPLKSPHPSMHARGCGWSPRDEVWKCLSHSCLTHRWGSCCLSEHPAMLRGSRLNAFSTSPRWTSLMDRLPSHMVTSRSLAWFNGSPVNNNSAFVAISKINKCFHLFCWALQKYRNCSNGFARNPCNGN